MLQQTQVAAMLSYYERFLEKFPDIEALAAASESEVLESWAGLGYYSRARNLHRAARQVMESHRGRFPREYREILALPGIGPYTAGAICSIAYNQPRAVVDGNIRRILRRLFGMDTKAAERVFWNHMATLLPPRRASSFNQAMMELGALICAPRSPQCPRCPVKKHCASATTVRWERARPERSGSRTEELNLLVLVLKKKGRVFIALSPKPDFIPGNWGLPCLMVKDATSAPNASRRLCRQLMGCAVPLFCHSPFRHAIGHRRLSVYVCCGAPDEPQSGIEVAPAGRWASAATQRSLLLSSIFRKALDKCSNTARSA